MVAIYQKQTERRLTANSASDDKKAVARGYRRGSQRFVVNLLWLADQADRGKGTDTTGMSDAEFIALLGSK